MRRLRHAPSRLDAFRLAVATGLAVTALHLLGAASLGRGAELHRLAESGAAAIGFDVLWSEEDEAGRRMAAGTRRSPRSARRMRSAAATPRAAGTSSAATSCGERRARRDGVFELGTK